MRVGKLGSRPSVRGGDAEASGLRSPGIRRRLPGACPAGRLVVDQRRCCGARGHRTALALGAAVLARHPRHRRPAGIVPVGADGLDPRRGGDGSRAAAVARGFVGESSAGGRARADRRGHVDHGRGSGSGNRMRSARRSGPTAVDSRPSVARAGVGAVRRGRACGVAVPANLRLPAAALRDDGVFARANPCESPGAAGPAVVPHSPGARLVPQGGAHAVAGTSLALLACPRLRAGRRGAVTRAAGCT
mmetsp:Transcript_46329/g.142912  ORF Transcript_46329/g.142912 Transcript_46329/m.142912 type:complete len:247 (-) Transcript_46329:1029-1769(-)